MLFTQTDKQLKTRHGQNSKTTKADGGLFDERKGHFGKRAALSGDCVIVSPNGGVPPLATALSPGAGPRLGIPRDCRARGSFCHARVEGKPIAEPDSSDGHLADA